MSGEDFIKFANDENDITSFLDESDSEKLNAISIENEPWKILIVDDDPEIHTITRFVLEYEKYDNRSFHFLSAYSRKEAVELLSEETDIVLVLLDVVMEREDDGFICVSEIREKLMNHDVRIILRTGQPGKSQSKNVIVDYEIDNYLSKTEITSGTLFTSVISALKTYQLLHKTNHICKSFRMQDTGKRDSVFMTNGNIRTVINAKKGMIPELSTFYDDRWINAHWQPWFRNRNGELWNDEKHNSFWKVALLYDIAGSFSCIPNFGPENTAGIYDLPPHGYTALEKWNQESIHNDIKTTSLISSLPEGVHPFRYKKKDLLIEGHHILYTRLDIKNTASQQIPFNCGWHNTVGGHFLEKGCIIDNNAKSFAIPPEGTEFDDTGQLAFGEVTESLENVPLRSGKTVNLRVVPGIIGYTDFITGSVPKECKLGWSSIVNPRLKLIYLSFFIGPAAVQKNELALNFYDLWMNYGGRTYTPWAPVDGFSDQTFCLGAETSTGYFANGLNQALKHPDLLGNPTYLNLEANEDKTLYYGTLFQAYEGYILDRGVRTVEEGNDELILIGYSGDAIRVKCDNKFKSLKNEKIE